jgi:hypothetical protein
MSLCSLRCIPVDFDMEILLSGLEGHGGRSTSAPPAVLPAGGATSFFRPFPDASTPEVASLCKLRRPPGPGGAGGCGVVEHNRRSEAMRVHDKSFVWSNIKASQSLVSNPGSNPRVPFQCFNVPSVSMSLLFQCPFCFNVPSVSMSLLIQCSNVVPMQLTTILTLRRCHRWSDDIHDGARTGGSCPGPV